LRTVDDKYRKVGIKDGRRRNGRSKNDRSKNGRSKNDRIKKRKKHARIT
jgi:hypothetical protein